MNKFIFFLLFACIISNQLSANIFECDNDNYRCIHKETGAIVWNGLGLGIEYRENINQEKGVDHYFKHKLIVRSSQFDPKFIQKRSLACMIQFLARAGELRQRLIMLEKFY